MKVFIPETTETETTYRVPETYLGDGLHVSFDGTYIKLRDPRSSGEHIIYLDPSIYRSLLEWIARYPPLWEYFAFEFRK